MSTMTIVETFDAQMIDYSADADFSMYPSTSDAWMPVEEDMGEEHRIVDLDSTSADIESIEVDMEPRDENEEYEMTDEVEEYNGDGDAELPDAEVFEVAQSPPQGTSALDDTQATLDTQPPEHSRLFPPHYDAPTDIDVQHDLVAHNAVLSGPSSEKGDQTVPYSVLDAEPVAEPVDAPADSRVDGSAEVSAIPAVVPDFSTHDDSAPFEAAVAGSVESFVEESSANIDTKDAVSDETSRPNDVSSPQASVATSYAHDEEAGPSDLGHFQHDNHTLDVVPQPAEETADLQREEKNFEAASSGDPHEISEGVYIDPPPAVLVWLSYATEEHECTLFNRPGSESGPSSPVDTSRAESESTMILLQDRPTLYYETLNTVFEALRQEELINNVTEFADGELVLDAFDLQLTISEDNIHAHEVTLHDLNVLHDGSDLAGPLRLRLYASSPRFITRYHALRDQIARLNLAAESEHHISEAIEGVEQAYNAGETENAEDWVPDVEASATEVAASGEQQLDESDRQDFEEVGETTERHFPRDESSTVEKDDKEDYADRENESGFSIGRNEELDVHDAFTHADAGTPEQVTNDLGVEDNKRNEDIDNDVENTVHDNFIIDSDDGRQEGASGDLLKSVGSPDDQRADLDSVFARSPAVNEKTLESEFEDKPEEHVVEGEARRLNHEYRAGKDESEEHTTMYEHGGDDVEEQEIAHSEGAANDEDAGSEETLSEQHLDIVHAHDEADVAAPRRGDDKHHPSPPFGDNRPKSSTEDSQPHGQVLEHFPDDDDFKDAEWDDFDEHSHVLPADRTEQEAASKRDAAMPVSTSSKRNHDQVDPDDCNDDIREGSPPTSLEFKRFRAQ